MRYIGSKISTLNALNHIIKPDVAEGCICDPFGGIGTVGSFFKEQGYQIISGDILKFAHYFQIAKIVNNTLPLFYNLLTHLSINSLTEMLEYLNNIDNEMGWFVEEYSNKRKFFTFENAKKIQACIDVIWEWHENKFISENEYAVLISSLINSMDKVANTAGTYYAHLKSFYGKATKKFRFVFLTPSNGNEFCKSYNTEALQLVTNNNCKILYLDPPYNERNYGKYYYLPEIIATKKITYADTKSGISKEYIAPKSSFYSKLNCKIAFEELLEKANFQYLLFHYSDAGLMSSDEVKKVLSKYIVFKEYSINCKGYSTTTKTYLPHHIYWGIRKT